MRNIILLVLCAAFIGVATGCSTVKGLGEDVKAIGGWISSGSDNVKENVGKGK